MHGHEDSPLLARVVAEFPEIFRHEILPLLVGSGGLPDIARALHVIGCHLTRETRVHSALEKRDRQCLPGRIARHVIGSHLIREPRVRSALGDVAGNVCQATLLATA
jgi:hypothetical protein